MTPNTRRGARGFVLPAATRPGHPGENTLLPDTLTELHRLGIRPRELVGDGGFKPSPTREAMPPGTRMFLSGRHEPGRQTHPQALGALPHRLRGAHLPHQAPLRAAPLPAEGP